MATLLLSLGLSAQVFKYDGLICSITTMDDPIPLMMVIIRIGAIKGHQSLPSLLCVCNIIIMRDMYSVNS